MKKKLAIAMITALALVGCGSSDNGEVTQESQETESNVESQEDVTVPTGEVTKESLMAMEENSVTDFEVYVDEEANEYVIYRYIGESDVVIIPNEIEGIPVGRIVRTAFINNNQGGTSIKAIRLPDNLHTIEEAAFTNCTELEVLVPGSGLKVIEEGVFGGCENLNQFEFPEGIEVIEFGGIPYNYKWDSVYYPSSLTSIKVGSLTQSSVIVDKESYAEQYFKQINEENPSSTVEIVYK